MHAIDRPMTLYLPNMQGKIKDCVQQCSVCNEYAHEQHKETMMSHPLATSEHQPVQLYEAGLPTYGGSLWRVSHVREGVGF